MDNNAPTSSGLRRGKSGKSFDTSSEEASSCSGEGSWYDKCKHCHCKNGMATCTEMSCEDGYSNLDGVCEGNVGFKLDCNGCSCDPDYGRAICTMIYCPALVGGLHNILTHIQKNKSCA